MSAPSATSSVGCLAIWGSGDLPGLGDQLLPQVTEQQLLARLPGWRISRFAPLGWSRPTVTDGGVIAAPLPVAHEATRITGSAQLSVVCPSFPVGITSHDLAETYQAPAAGPAAPWFGSGGFTSATASHPVLWSGVRVAERLTDAVVDQALRQPYLAVRDTRSRDRLRDAGVGRDIAVVPHPGLLAGGLVADDVLHTRAQSFRVLGLLPADNDYLVLHVTGPLSDALLDAARDVLGEVAAERVVVLPTGQIGNGPIEESVDILPVDLVMEDRLAVLSTARAVITTDEHVAAACAGLGVRWVLLDPTGEHRSATLEFGYAKQIAETPKRLRTALRAVEGSTGKDKAGAALAAHFDRIAQLAQQALAADGGHPERRIAELAEENIALRAAHDRLRRHMFVERQRLIDPLADAFRARDVAEARLASASAQLAELTERNRELAAQLAEREREVQAWRNTKLVRWTHPVRQVYAKMHRP